MKRRRSFLVPTWVDLPVMSIWTATKSALSATDLVHLSLLESQHSVYCTFPPMRWPLPNLHLRGSKDSTFSIDRALSRKADGLPLPARSVLYAFAAIGFSGVSEYLDDLAWPGSMRLYSTSRM
jgi:hypothetical protein